MKISAPLILLAIIAAFFFFESRSSPRDPAVQTRVGSLLPLPISHASYVTIQRTIKRVVLRNVAVMDTGAVSSGTIPLSVFISPSPVSLLKDTTRRTLRRDNERRRGG